MSLRRLAATAAVMAVVACAARRLSPGAARSGPPHRGPAGVRRRGGAGHGRRRPRRPAGVGRLGAGARWACCSPRCPPSPGFVAGRRPRGGRVLLPSDARRAAARRAGRGADRGSPVLTACSAGPARPPPSRPCPRSRRCRTGRTGRDLRASPPPAVPRPVGPERGHPRSAAGPVPEWPADEHVVVRGDCLWDIAAADLRERSGSEPSGRGHRPRRRGLVGGQRRGHRARPRPALPRPGAARAGRPARPCRERAPGMTAPSATPSSAAPASAPESTRPPGAHRCARSG